MARRVVGIVASGGSVRLAASRIGRSRQHQVDVAELVPQVALGQRRGVGALEQLAAGDRLEHRQVRRLGLVPSGEQAVDRADRAVRRDHGLGPATAGVDLATLVDHRLEGPHHGGADGDDAAALAAGVVDPAGRGGWDPEVLGVGRLEASSEATPVCSTIGVTPTPLATSRVSTSGVNGRPALGISAEPGSVA